MDRDQWTSSCISGFLNITTDRQVDYESTSIDDALYILDSGKSDGIGLIMIF